MDTNTTIENKPQTTENKTSVTPTNAQVVTDAERAFAKPVYRTRRHDHGYALEVEMPGVPKTGLSLTVEDRILTVTGTRNRELPGSWRPLHQELAQADYRLKLQLGAEIDEDHIKANLENGVLQLHLPVREAAKPRTIPID